MERPEITKEYIENFFNGNNPQERIVNLLYSYKDDFIEVVRRDENDNKFIEKESFYPFLFATEKACRSLCNGDKSELKSLLRKYKIWIKPLSTISVDGKDKFDQFSDGFRFLFYATSKMSYNKFLEFFKVAKFPTRFKEKGNATSNPEYLTITPQEQYLVYTGKRFFKGYDDYDCVYRMIFDIETTGLNPYKNRITQIGIRTNRGFEKIFSVEGETKEELDMSELTAIDNMLRIIYTMKPDAIIAHNGENFDWYFIIERCNEIGVPIKFLSEKYFNGDYIRKNNSESILKLGGEVETYYPTVVPGVTVIDSLHAVRRAQAIDSNFLKGDLKYSTKYLHLVKKNRVYVPGDIISDTWSDNENKYAFNDEDGTWYKLKNGDEPKIGYSVVSGRYIVERYLLDDLWECDKVEAKLNTTNFLISKMLPIPYKKCTTMGTAGQWKMLMLAWSYELGLAIPNFKPKKKFTGGLSRLLNVGYVDNVVKLDYNSLYPSITLTWGIYEETDLMYTTLKFLEHILTAREYYKGLKKNADKIISKYDNILLERNLTEEEKSEYEKACSDYSFNDKKQSQMKVFANSFFGSYGAPNIFPWGSTKCAEQITCTGRQCLRLMISHFTKLGYKPIVGDTDGFNFKLPSEDKFRYTKENPYIGLGMNREVKCGAEYYGFEADVAEFNDIYMKDFKYSEMAVNKMGLGIDEVITSSINFSRKNYADYFPSKSEPDDVKLVGNTVKSKKMPEYISKFLSKGIRMLLKGNGREFIEWYYEYVERIYNYRIPLKDIASKGSIKKSLQEYQNDTKTVTKAGVHKSRQAWYEIAIKYGMKVDNGDTIYYINVGNSKNQSDVKKNTYYYVTNNDGVKENVTKDINKEYTKYRKISKEQGIKPKPKNEYINEKFPNAKEEFEIELYCVPLNKDIIDSDSDVFCDNENKIEYNTAKYIEMFNKRITPLLVCFNPSIRENILIKEPSERRYFTDSECELCSGLPNKSSDQDTYEQLMTMEDKELRFWTSINKKPPFFDECDMGDWDSISKEYIKRMEEENINGIAKEREEYENIITSLTEEEKEEFIENFTFPEKLSKISKIDYDTCNIVSITDNKTILGSIYDIIDDYKIEDE